MRTFGMIIAVLLAAGLVLGLWWHYRDEPMPEDGPADSVEAPPEVEAEPPEPMYPVPEPEDDRAAAEPDTEEAPEPEPESAEPAPKAEPLPPLEESDAHMRSSLLQAVPAAILDDWLKDERVVERLVATIHSLDGKAIPLRFRPIHHLEGLPAVQRDGDTLTWSPANRARYRPAIGILDAIEPATVARVYFRNYPLFQQAYEALGLEQAHFNDRLVEIVDHLLGAPMVEPGFEVKQPKVLYEFADPELEGESWGRKLLMRMGPENAERVKNWLRRLRVELVSGALQEP